MTEKEFKNLQVGDVIEVITDSLYCNPTAYYKYRAKNTQYYPIGTLFKVVVPITGLPGSIGTQIIINDNCVPNTGGRDNCCWFSFPNEHSFKLYTSTIDTNIVY